MLTKNKMYDILDEVVVTIAQCGNVKLTCLPYSKVFLLTIDGNTTCVQERESVELYNEAIELVPA